MRSLFASMSPPAQLRVMLTQARSKLRALDKPETLLVEIRGRQDSLLTSGSASLQHLCSIHRTRRSGPIPTIVLGGFVPDASESVFLLRDMLLRYGSLYCIKYPRKGFNLELVFAQLDDLVDEIRLRHHCEPAILGISFGCGVLLEWLRRRRVAGGYQALSGIILVSPVTCVDDLIEPGATKPDTLLGRAIQPYISGRVDPDQNLVERSRTIFSKMFGAGAQNKEALAMLMTEEDARHLKDAVLESIRSIDVCGARERVRALQSMLPPSSYFNPSLLPLSDAPCLVLYAEREDSVVTRSSPARFAFETAHRAYFSRSRFVLVKGKGSAPVQHASLIFHCREFHPHISNFYKRLRKDRIRSAA